MRLPEISSNVWTEPVLFGKATVFKRTIDYFNTTNHKPRFFDDVIVQFLVEEDRQDRIVRVYKKFGFLDSRGNYWEIPEGEIVNGASIPRILWTVYGSPYTGDYRRAAVLHDYGCDSHKFTTYETNCAFYDAMRVDNVGFIKANIMYKTVDLLGPKWEGVAKP